MPVARDLLPCPLPFPEVAGAEVVTAEGVSRAVRSRLRRKAGWMSWANDAVRSMNEMYGQGDVFE